MRLPFLNSMINYLNVNMIVVGYRGYGPSEGFPSEDGIKLDVKAIIKFVLSELKSDINLENLYVLGRSLGGACAIYAQATYPTQIKGLILENTFLSIEDLVDKLFPFLSYLKNFMLRNKWLSRDLIGKIEDPILFIMSEKDEIVPYEHMTKLYDLAVKSKNKQKVRLNFILSIPSQMQLIMMDIF